MTHRYPPPPSLEELGLLPPGAAVGTRGSGLFLSADGGRTWHPAGTGGKSAGG